MRWCTRYTESIHTSLWYGQVVIAIALWLESHVMVCRQDARDVLTWFERMTILVPKSSDVFEMTRRGFTPSALTTLLMGAIMRASLVMAARKASSQA
jgi:hypothetical protein